MVDLVQLQYYISSVLLKPPTNVQKLSCIAQINLANRVKLQWWFGLLKYVVTVEYCPYFLLNIQQVNTTGLSKNL